MPLFALYAKDGPQGPALRDEHRAEHMAFMNRIDGEKRVLFAGPLKDRIGGRSVGSLIVFEAEDEDAAQALMAEDPYARAGVFAAAEVLPCLKAFPK